MKLNLVLLMFFALQRHSVTLLYAGPDQLIPIASFLGAIVGVLLIFWQRFVSLLKRIFHFFSQKLRPSGAVSKSE